MNQINPETYHSPNLAGAHGVVMQHESSKLLPWLMLTTLLAGIALGVSILMVITQGQSETRNHAELDRQYRFLQELRVRVEDAEMAAKEVNKNYNPPR